MLKTIFFALLFISISGCTTPKFVGKLSSSYQHLSCTLDEGVCKINYGNNGYISYVVEKIDVNTYNVKGNVDLNMSIVGGMHAKVSFYVIFMDENQVQFERKVKTGSRKATFEFEVKTEHAILKTNIEKMSFHTWS